MPKVAPQAGLWHNRASKNVVAQRCWKHPEPWINLCWRLIMDTVSPHADYGNIPQKTCTKCGQSFPPTTEYFYAHKEGKDGLNASCKQCVRNRNKSYRLDHLDYYHAYLREHYQSHASEVREKQNLYRQQHPEQKREWDKVNAERLREYRRQNIDKIRTHTRNRQARKMGNGGTHTHQDIQQQLERQKGKCYYCKSKLGKYHVDHIVPLSRGGLNDPSNLVVTCPTCNFSKNDRLPHEWPQGGRLL